MAETYPMIKEIAKKYLPAPVRATLSSAIRKYRLNRERCILTFFASSAFLSGVYYLIFNRSFDREHRAVIAGRAGFASDLRQPSLSSFRLRRNVHRLEKGLIMPDRRSVFALNYIGPTVDDFGRIVRSYSANQPLSVETIWAHDVLSKYFSVVDLEHPRLKECYARFVHSQKLFSMLDRQLNESLIPFVRDLENRPVSIEQFEALASRRRSVRNFTCDPVDRAHVDQAVAIAAQSPSACNRQPFQFRLFDAKKLVEKIIELPAGAKGFCDKLNNVAVVVGRLRAYPLERDRHIIYVDGSLAAMSFMFALECLGIATCAINWADEEPAESRMRDLLNLQPDERVVMLIGYGWPAPDAMVPRSAKRDLDELRDYNRL